MKKFLIIMVIFFLGSALSAEYLVDDCEDGDSINAQGGKWYTTDDSDSGGKSTVMPKPGKFKMTKTEDGYAAGMKGKTGLKRYWKESDCRTGKNISPGSCPVARGNGCLLPEPW